MAKSSNALAQADDTSLDGAGIAVAAEAGVVAWVAVGVAVAIDEAVVDDL